MCFLVPCALHWRQRMCCSLTMQQWLSNATPVYCFAHGLYFIVELHFWYSTTAGSVQPAHGSCAAVCEASASTQSNATATVCISLAVGRKRNPEGVEFYLVG